MVIYTTFTYAQNVQLVDTSRNKHYILMYAPRQSTTPAVYEMWINFFSIYRTWSQLLLMGMTGCVGRQYTIIRAAAEC